MFTEKKAWIRYDYRSGRAIPTIVMSEHKPAENWKEIPTDVECGFTPSPTTTTSTTTTSTSTSTSTTTSTTTTTNHVDGIFDNPFDIPFV